MDKGIIQCFKVLYRKQVAHRKLESIEYGYELDPITILESIKFVDHAWKNVTKSTLKNCFRKAGFKLDTCDNTIEEINLLVSDDKDIESNITEYKSICEKIIASKTVVDFNEDFNYDDFLHIDSNLQSSGEISDEEILQKVAEKSSIQPNQSPIDEVEVEDEAVPLELITKQEKDKAFETLRMYLLQSKQDCTALLQELNRFEQTYEDKTAKPKTQSSIFSYFKAQ